MRYENGVSELYIRKFPRKVRQYNRPLPFPAYLLPFVGNAKSLRVAELGAGPICTLGDELPGVEVAVVASDIMWPEYLALWEAHGGAPRIPVAHEDMEDLSYPAETFDIVHCRNAADHTPDIQKAIREMQRVCRRGGWVYLAHAPSQKRKFGGHHHWNFEEVELPGFRVYEEDGLIVAVWQKP